ncbi:hypothetical protein GLIP_3862 [Aliiglaciecola lipolytica E3]|uniref:Uncharacterized protein n=1 Tax=Aliiglaciecola lipolytica E3 TaxID=1127673 RepID=K6YIN6_9ALTE|nr:hypothetical protein GLIP_3862 [Aliiglaciecola lipolytica E3]
MNLLGIGLSDYVQKNNIYLFNFGFRGQLPDRLKSGCY